MNDLLQFLEPIDLNELTNYENYYDSQLGKHINIYSNQLPDISSVDIVIIGVAENRGDGDYKNKFNAPNHIRKELYELHYWHKNIKIADLGNIVLGANLKDTYAALQIVLVELFKENKTVLILGGSHDISLPQYNAYATLQKSIEATCIDATINLSIENPLPSKNFLEEMLTRTPNFIKHYNHIGFQSYFIHPKMLETLDKLRFDCYRLGMVKENIDEIEPVLRNSNLVSFDISAIKYSDAPANTESPNGFTGEEACTLTRFAGMSSKLTSLGIFGYNPTKDLHTLTAKQIAQMIWYFIDGKNRALQEASITNRDQFNEYHCTFSEIETIFLQSKKTARWWMILPNKKIIACTYNDYLKAVQNEIPDTWLRSQERGE